MSRVTYPSAERVIEFNILAITLISAKKADKAVVLSRAKLEAVLTLCREREGDIHDKAVVLLQGLVKQHVFASGNRRTAFLVTKEFLLVNKGKFGIPDDPAQVTNALRGIRENFYTHEEIKEWIKDGKIRPFRR